MYHAPVWVMIVEGFVIAGTITALVRQQHFEIFAVACLSHAD
jgi:hypothetical protein